MDIESREQPSNQPPRVSISHRIRYIFSKEITERYIHFFTLIIALLSFYVAWDSKQANDEFNRNSVMPILTIEIDVNKKNKSLIKMQNDGEGVAILKGMEVLPTNIKIPTHFEPIEWGTVIGTLKEAREKIKSEDYPIYDKSKGSKYSCSDTIPNYTLGVGEVKNLISFDKDYGFISKEMPISLKACYCSIYNECWTTTFLKGYESIPNCDNFTEYALVQC